MSASSRCLAWLDRRLTWFVASGLVIGLVVPSLAATLRSVMPGLLVILIALPLMRLVADFGLRVFLPTSARAVLLSWCAFGGFLLLWLVGSLLPISHETLLVLLLVGASPPLLALPAFAQMIGMDARDLAFAGLAGTLLAPISLPLCLAVSGLGTEEFDLLAVGGRFLAVVGLALAIALILRRSLGDSWLLRQGKPLGRFTALVLLLLAIALMDGIHDFWRSNPQQVLFYTLLVFAVSLGLQGAGYLAFRPAGKQVALAAAIAGSNRNLALTLAAIGGVAPAAFEVYVALGQLPIFLLPALFAPLYRRLMPAAEGGRHT